MYSKRPITVRKSADQASARYHENHWISCTSIMRSWAILWGIITLYARSVPGRGHFHRYRPFLRKTEKAASRRSLEWIIAKIAISFTTASLRICFALSLKSITRMTNRQRNSQGQYDTGDHKGCRQGAIVKIPYTQWSSHEGQGTSRLELAKHGTLPRFICFSGH